MSDLKVDDFAKLICFLFAYVHFVFIFIFQKIIVSYLKMLFFNISPEQKSYDTIEKYQPWTLLNTIYFQNWLILIFGY